LDIGTKFPPPFLRAIQSNVSNSVTVIMIVDIWYLWEHMFE